MDTVQSGGRASFGEMLKRYRRAAGLSQETLAERARMSVRGISDLERGLRQQPYRDTIAQLAEALGLAASERAALEEAVRRQRESASGVGPARSEQPGEPLLATKLSIPPARAALVSRPRLVERLQAGLRGPLTLISAPPGCGKTTLLSAWHAGLHDRTLAVAWVSLDATDNDPARFWTYVFTAIDRVQPGTASSALAALQSLQAPPIEALLTSVLNALSAHPVDSVLVLDDYHVIEAQPIHQGLAFLVDHLPSHLHLLLASRADPPLPLARLRARGSMTELRAADLRFTVQEAGAFLTDLMGLPLGSEAVAALEARTEGWIAGLQLAALSLQDRPADAMAAFIAAFTGSNRHVVDYLLEEVLSRQPEAVQTFLLRTSILERLCAPLCAAVVGDPRRGEDGTDGEMASQALLEHLERGNIFVVALDEERRWYRYHHLFADVLRIRLQRVQPRLVPELHQRASDWFEAAGLTRGAVTHALAAGAYEHAAVLLEQSALPLFQHGAIQTLRGWFDALPDEVLRARPRLRVAQAVLQQDRHNQDEVENYLQDAEQLLQAGTSIEDARAIQGDIAAVRTLSAAMRGDAASVIEHARIALDQLDQANRTMRGVVAVSLGIAHAQQGDLARAVQSFSDAVATVRSAGPAAGAVTLAAFGNLSYVQRAQGRLHLARTTCQEALDWAGIQRVDASPVLGGVHLQLADLLCAWNDLDAASAYLTEGLARLTAWGRVDLRMLALIGQARLLHAQHALTGALAVLAQAEELGRKHHDRWGLAVLQACRAQVWLTQGNLPAAIEWSRDVEWHAELAGSRLGPIFFIYSYEHTGTAPLQVLVAQGRDSGDRALLYAALERLDQQRQEAERQGLPWRRIKALALQALAWQALGDLNQAIASLEQALAVAEPEGYIRIFVDEGKPMADLLREAHIRGIRPTYAAILLAALGWR